MSRWFNSTDARDIGILYLILSIFSGMVGSSFSLLIRLQLMDVNQEVVLGIPYQAYNTIITLHAILMIFFLVMPAMFGGFGNLWLSPLISSIKTTTTKSLIFFYFYKLLIISLLFSFNIRNIHLNIKKDSHSKIINNHIELGHYLAGLIEGDGSIIVSKNKKYNPKIIIVFNKDDYNLVLFLKNNFLDCGSIIKKSGYIIWQIQDLKGVIKIFNLINGKMRTPKIEDLHRGIIYLKDLELLEKNFPLLKLDNSPIYSNSWLSGFIDADGNFSLNVYKRKNNNYRVICEFRIELTQNYKNSFITDNGAYFNIVSKISSEFNVNIYSRSRNTNYGFSQNFIIVFFSKESLLLLKDYLNKYPLFSSKYLNYLDFYKVIELKNNYKLTKDYIEEVLKIKKNFNKNRTIFNWDHLR